VNGLFTRSIQNSQVIFVTELTGSKHFPVRPHSSPVELRAVSQSAKSIDGRAPVTK
jgi:hypothetical protein